MNDPRLYVMTCGSLFVERAFITHFGSALDRGKPYETASYQIASSQYFIDHPDAKIVVDLGFTIEDYTSRTGFPLRANEQGFRFKQEKHENPKAQLEKIGVSIDDIDYVVITHLMLEHAGYLPLFDGKKAKIVVQRKELEYAYANVNPKSAPEPFHAWMYYANHFNRPGLNFMIIEGDHMLVPGVEVLSTPGHTPGYQMVRVDLKKEGTVFLSLCEIESMYFGRGINAQAPGVPHAFTYSSGDELRSFRRIIELSRRANGKIFFGHDQAQFDSLKKLPQFYD